MECSAPPLTICTERPTVLRRRCEAVQIPLRVLSPQPAAPGPLDVLPDCAPPYLLDTIGMPPLVLASLLVAIERQQALPARPGVSTLVGAILDPDDLVARRLVALAPSVRLLMGDTLPWQVLVPWARQLHTLTPVSRVVSVGIAALRRPDLPSHFLTILAALPHAASVGEVAEQCALSQATVLRVLARARTALHLPGGRTRHFTPPTLAAACVQALSRSDLALPSRRRSTPLIHD